MQSGNLNENLHRFITRRAIAIGAGGLGRFFAESLSVKQYYHIDLIGFIDDDTSKLNTIVNGIPVLGGTSNLNNLVIEQGIDEIYITIQKIDNKALLDLIEKCKLTSCQINLVSNHFDIINAKLDVNEFHDLKIISISSKASPLYSEKFKRIFDIIISSILIGIVLIPALIVSTLIKLTSAGSVFYKTAVIGKDGKPFYWFKFRTMYTNSDPSIHKEHLKKLIIENHANQKLINDLRITKFGKILRKFSLDELPQLLNVFNGDMSLVGPRPCLPYEYEIFKDWHKLKYKVIPGMTGLAQITARNRKDVTFNDSVLLDLYYADNQSLWLDLKILFKTVPILMFGKGGI
jgi:exopolysaccharide biosynthesis polyprenyl glycosylphosphotransferase